MGCFSFKCLECGQGVNSTSFQGELVKLFLLQDGKIIQQMEGEYDSYGTVFMDGTQDSSVQHSLRLSHKWDCPELRQLALEEDPEANVNDPDELWGTVCELMERGSGHQYFKLPDLYPNLKGMSEQDKTKVPKEWMKNKGTWEWLEGYEPKPGNGIAAIHVKCYKTDPKVQSERDPDQGWNKLHPKHMPEGYVPDQEDQDE